ncbi:MAG: DNA primase [Candidatus Aenigmarchaeota archaeon]|nr:DNA primase [Candidatus Aenigmarchaeota archaeon]
MSKLAPTSIKYVIKAGINAQGVIEKPDVIGAIFGQTEGLLGSDLDLRELQRTGRIGRIEVNINSDKGKSYGEVIIPSSLDSAETALIAATLETIERVGPCTAKINLKSVEDTRELKRKFVVDKAKSILKELLDKGISDTSKIAEEIKEEIKTYEITTYKTLPCGPNILESEDIIVVEGRADVINLIKYGIKNVIAMQGSSIPTTIMELSKQKTTTAFLDNDRGGELNLKSLLETSEIDYVAIAPDGKEVEELSKKEVFKALRDKVAASQFKIENNITNGNKKTTYTKKEKYVSTSKYKQTKKEVPEKKFVSRVSSAVNISEDQKKIFKKTLDELIGTRAACIFDSTFNILGKVPVKELENTLSKLEDDPYAVIFDGKVDYKLDLVAKRKGIKFLVGMDKEDVKSSVKILSKKDLI